VAIDAKDAITGRLHLEPPIAKRIALLWFICHALATVLLDGSARRVEPNRPSEDGVGSVGQAGIHCCPILNKVGKMIEGGNLPKGVVLSFEETTELPKRGAHYNISPVL
jgi:hypothetical protein